LETEEHKVHTPDGPK